jgi:c-di-GMP-binding flagellar brake protein YcgR
MSDNPGSGTHEDLRKSVRKILLSDAIFVSKNVRLKSAVTIDISTGGLSLFLPEALEVGVACAISFDVPSTENKQRTLIRGTVASCVDKGADGYRIGVHYVEPDPISKQLIQEAVDSYLDQTN